MCPFSVCYTSLKACVHVERKLAVLKLKYVRKTYYASPQSHLDIDAIKERYGCSTDSDAIRLALTLVAQSPIAQIAAKKKARAQ